MKSWLAGNRVPPMHDVKAGLRGGVFASCVVRKALVFVVR